MKKFNLSFQGYWFENDSMLPPAEPGVLCAFACEPATHGASPRLTRPLRITDCLSARASFLATRASGELAPLLIAGERLAYSFAPLLFGREEAAAAMIYRFKPLGNHEHKYSFRFEPVQVELGGKIGRLGDRFISPDPHDKDISRLLERLGLSLTA